MKQIKRIICLVLVANFFLIACSNNDEEIVKQQVEYNNKQHSITLNSVDKKTKEIVIISEPNKLVDVTVNFLGNKNISRLYVTKNVYSEAKGASPFQFSNFGQKKKDGSVELLKQNQKEFINKFKFEAPKKKDDIVEYHLWVTTKRGDFRNASKHNAVNERALCKVIIKSGKDVKLKPITLKTFSSVVLKSSLLKEENSFRVFSTLDGKVHKLSEDDEYAFYWDLAYFWGFDDSNPYIRRFFPDRKGKYNGKLASLNPYMRTLIYKQQKSLAYISSISKHKYKYRGLLFVGREVASYKFNTLYWFREGKSTIADFDAISKGSDLKYIDKFHILRKSSFINLRKGLVKEFVNSYGERGIIKVTNFIPGGNGQVEFDIKIQVREEPFIESTSVKN